jgi:uncharacterized protein YbbC (DUF1343 family)/CubicO group peptidase (beta-lactamase class C family)
MLRLLLWFGLTVPVAAEISADKLRPIDEAVTAALTRRDCPGVVVLVVHRDKVVWRKASGQRALATESAEMVAMTPETIFDLASITKPVATATSVAILLEQGKLKRSEKVATYWPEFAANGKENVTVEQCLLHTSGLTADNAIGDYQGGKADAMKKIAGLKLEADPGTRFRYSDVGFIVLGELVERVGDLPLDRFAKQHIFDPLKMADTGYTPDLEHAKRCAPTSEAGKKTDLRPPGEVHDPRAGRMGGVAGHAGLFGTADDLARFARMLLHGGELDGQRILSPLSVRLLTTAIPVPGGLRSRGWDVDTGFSTPRGEGFPKGSSFGHTGFTGTSVWIDPASQTAVIILTNRVHFSEKVSVTTLRKEVANIVAKAIEPPQKVTAPGVVETRCGIDVLIAEKFKRLAGRNVGLVTNHTGRDRANRMTADILHAASATGGFKMVAHFSPEHGIRGELDQAKIADSVDAKTGLPVWSLYGKRRKPNAETLKGIDTIVYDIQDIGCRFYTYISTLRLCLEAAAKSNKKIFILDRFYTYISTLGNVLEAAAEHKIRVVVLDRPNPIGGVAIDGPLTDAGRESFIAAHSLPLRHGMTVGEIAKMMAAERKLTVELEIVKVENWSRTDTFDRTGLTWVNPSPNMRTLTAALLYPGIGLLETTNLSVGRGTERPFEWIGAPWLDGAKLANLLNRADLAGVRFVPTNVTPTSSVHANKPCGGVQILVTDWATFNPLKTGFTIAMKLRDLYPDQWETKNYDRLLVHKATCAAFLAGANYADLEALWANDLKSFRERRKGFLLYGE